MPLRVGHMLLLAALMLWGAALGRDGFDRWVAATPMPASLIPETSVQVLARDGSLLRAFTVADGRWRMAVSAEGVDPGYIAMLLAYEDRRFRSHNGVDGRAMLRASWQALRSGGIVSGGSTLTMQVARLIEDGPTGQWRGKLRQIRLALALERRLSKAQILDLYLHHAPFGGNLEGVRAATLAYLGKEPRRLTPAEAALMVALPQSPELRRPDRHPARAGAARDRVLGRTAEAGVIAPEVLGAALAAPVPDARAPFPALAPHLAERLLRDHPERATHHTTIDAGLQRQLEVLARAAIDGRGDRVTAAIIVADHRTGEILARVGSADYTDEGRQGFVDMTRAVRSPGSALKPLVYAMAFDDGLAHPETLIEDRPTRFGNYSPQNFDRQFRGTVRLRAALQLSLNIPVVALTDALGPVRVMAALRRAGAAPVLPGRAAPGLAIALGGVGVTLEGLVALYAGLADGGQAQPLHDMPQAAPQQRARLVSPEAAWHVADILADAPPPPGAPANRLAYKTGTSYGYRDGWAIGYDGAHVAGVWIGRADGTPVPGVFGGDVAAPVLFEVFSRLKPLLDRLPPPPPSTLMVSTAGLPPPLQRFSPRGAALGPPADAPKVAFPPDGAEVETGGAPLVVRVAEGQAPFTWLADGLPVARGMRQREATLDLGGPGFYNLSVIDAEGRAAQVRVRLR
ncbi:penicillin-binding protein 1C [Alkalilacustris brevis]|uniref:penicillin-binding protein 1C n=1 Tax=Alkalilacustris brevis TaxID=2026338 RepID=UPI000E0D5017|nr:penicillin-binding protein 1C [Alkalilacustris brevis]